VRDIPRLGREVIYEAKVMRCLLKVISSTVRKYSGVEDVSFRDAPGIES
jgi:hypothetical protein